MIQERASLRLCKCICSSCRPMDTGHNIESHIVHIVIQQPLMCIRLFLKTIVQVPIERRVYSGFEEWMYTLPQKKQGDFVCINAGY